MARSLLETPWAIAIDPARRDGRIVAESSEEEREAKTVAIPDSLDPALVEALRRAGVERLYSHQREALDAAATSNLVITSGTASGKSLAFNLPVLDGIARDSKRRALYLYPTKALAQDQARKLASLRPPGLREAIYDGDTPREERPAIRRRNNLVLTNPDMLHVGLLPHHKSWGDFLANLGWVVVDEAHTYRGVFGSHVANVLRRLRRIARAYGSEPRFLLASATIANPVELAERLVGEPFEPIDDDGAPSTGREIAMWNPPLIDKATGTRRSPLSEAAELLVELVSQGVRTICFLKSRRGIELIQRFARDGLERARQAGAGGADRALPGRLHAAAAARDRGAARGGRAAGGGRDRRARAGHRHRRARRGDLRHLPRHGRQPAADVGAGGTAPPRARRLRRRPGRPRPVLLPPSRRVHRAAGGGGDPRPRKRADRRPPPGRRRLRAAAQRRGRRDLRRRAGAQRAERLVAAGELRRAGGRLLPRSSEFVASKIAAALGLGRLGRRDRARLRGDARPGRGRARLHHDPSRRRLPPPRSLLRGRAARRRGRRAIVSRFDGDWYTRPKKETEIYIERVREQRSTAGVELHFGEVSVSEQVIAFQRVSISEQEPIDVVALELPEQHFVTQALWYVLPDRLSGALPPDVLLGALHATEHGQIAVLPLIAMCDRWDIGGLSTNVHFQTGRSTIFIYDGHPGGVGITLRGYEQFERLLGDAERLIAECPCESGCPSCVQSPKCGNLNEPLHKEGALELMRTMKA